MPSIEELEIILDNLDKAENILNEVVVFTPNEMNRFNMKTRKPVMSVGLLKITKRVNDGFNDAIQTINELAIKEFLKANISLVQGKIVHPTQLNSILSGLVKIQHELIQSAKEQGNDKVEKYELELNEMIMYSNLFEAEIGLAKTQDEIRKIIEKYSSKLFDFS